MQARLLKAEKYDINQSQQELSAAKDQVAHLERLLEPLVLLIICCWRLVAVGKGRALLPLANVCKRQRPSSQLQSLPTFRIIFDPQEHEKDDNRRLLASLHSSQAREISLRSRARAIQLVLCVPGGRELISRCV